MVFLQHYYRLPWGWTGVNIFFVLSGFLITGILFDTRDAPFRARNFYIRRTLRIFPLYYGIFFVLLLLHPLLHWDWSLAWIAWPLYLGNFLRFTSPATSVAGSPQQRAADAQIHSPHLPQQTLYLGHFWSLCVEEQFYLIWPWIVFWVRSRRALLWVCGVTVVVVPLLRVLTQQLAPHWMLASELLYRATPFQLDSLLLGGLIGLLLRGPHRERLLQLGRIVALIAAIATIAYLAVTLHSDWHTNYHYPTWRLTWGLTFVNIFSAAIILTILRPTGFLYRFFKLPALRWIGRISYGAYVLHDILHSFFGLIFGPIYNRLYKFVIVPHGPHFFVVHSFEDEAFTLFSFAATLFLAWLSFNYFERPFLNLKERWTIRD
jgi:peptidoglycan/LPS O-acetylase OafA/YrhL